MKQNSKQGNDTRRMEINVTKSIKNNHLDRIKYLFLIVLSTCLPDQYLYKCMPSCVNVCILSNCSMTASPTATNPATLFSSGPKVSARGRCPPTHYQLHFIAECQNVRALSHAAHVAHYSMLLKSHFIIALSATLQQLLEEMFCNLSCSCCSFSPPLSSPLVPVVSPGVNTGGVGSYVYEKEPSAVTQP